MEILENMAAASIKRIHDINAEKILEGLTKGGCLELVTTEESAENEYQTYLPVETVLRAEKFSLREPFLFKS